MGADGTVTGVAKGTATITVKTYNGKKATVKIRVVPATAKPTEVPAAPVESQEPAAEAVQPVSEQPEAVASEADAVSGPEAPVDVQADPPEAPVQSEADGTGEVEG